MHRRVTVYCVCASAFSFPVLVLVFFVNCLEGLKVRTTNIKWILETVFLVALGI